MTVWMQPHRDTVHGSAARVAVVKVERGEHDGRRGRVHQCVWDVARVRNMVCSEVEVENSAKEVPISSCPPADVAMGT